MEHAQDQKKQQADQTSAANQLISPRRASKRLAGLEADPPLDMKKPRAKRGSRKIEMQQIQAPDSEIKSTEILTGSVGETSGSFPTPKPELYDVPGFEFAYDLLTDAIPLPDYLLALDKPTQ